MAAEEVRLQKYMAQRGVGSRRRCEQYILEGRVRVNGRVVTELGSRVDPARDRVTLGHTPLPASAPRPVTIVLHKPRGYLCTRARGTGRTVYALIPELQHANLVPVGRLDKNSEGLLLMSNDGALVLRLSHPRYGHRKTYRVTVSGAVTPEVLHELRAPMTLDSERTQPAGVRWVQEGAKPGRTILEFQLCEGRNRQIRRMCEAVGLRVHRLVRVRIDRLRLSGLEPGEWRELTPGELQILRGPRSA